MDNNSLEQIQNLLAQVSNYASKINEIILQINNIINSQNQMKQMMLMNQMMQMNMINNNMINFENNFNPNLNPLLNNQMSQQLNARKINIVFNYQGNSINVVAEEYLPINEVINRFLKKIDKPEFINNYQKKMTFLLGGERLDCTKNVKEINEFSSQRLDIVAIINNMSINVVEK